MARPVAGHAGSVNYWLLIAAVVLLTGIFSAPMVVRFFNAGQQGCGAPPESPAQEAISHQGSDRVSEKIPQKPPSPPSSSVAPASETAVEPSPEPPDLEPAAKASGLQPYPPAPTAQETDTPRGGDTAAPASTTAEVTTEPAPPEVAVSQETTAPPETEVSEPSAPLHSEEKPAPRPPETAAEPETETARIRYVRVQAGNVRAGPSLDADVKFRIRKGDTVTVTDQQDKWYTIELEDGRTGWAHQSLFTRTPPSKPQKKKRFKEILAIRPILTADNRTGVIFELNGYHPPETQVLDGDHPRLVCDFPDTRLNCDVPLRRELKKGHIERIRIGIHDGPQSKVRVVMDFKPGQDYTIEQLFYKKENYYALMVKAREDHQKPAQAASESPEGQQDAK